MITNGVGEPRYPIADVKPGSIARFGVDDDMTVMVIANYIGVGYYNNAPNGIVTKPVRKLVFFGCFCDEPDEYDRGRRPYEEGRLIHQDLGLNDTLTIVRAFGV